MGIVTKGNFIDTITQEEYEAGLIKFNIPSVDDLYSLNGEGVWGWTTPEDKRMFEDDNFEGNITAILLNSPIRSPLHHGDEVVLKCHGKNRPTVDPEWMKENVLPLRKATEDHKYKVSIRVDDGEDMKDFVFFDNAKSAGDIMYDIVIKLMVE